MTTPDIGSAETLLWSGRGGVGPRDGRLIRFVAALAFGIAVMATLVSTIEPLGAALQSVPGKGGLFITLIAGLIPAVLIDPLWTALLNRFTAYGLTDQHLIWVRSSPFRLRRQLRLADIREISRTDLADRRGNLVLVTVPDYESSTGEMKSKTYELARIESAATLEKLIQERRARWATVAESGSGELTAAVAPRAAREGSPRRR